MKVTSRTDSIKSDTTFGFEAEWDRGAESLNDILYSNGECRTESLHNWHCSCDSCSPWGDTNFYGQNDSSCSGEIISTVHTFSGAQGQKADNVFANLSAYAYSVGAIPGTDSGFHVHVGVGHLTTTERAQTLAAFARWERVLSAISAGASQNNRGYNCDVSSGPVGNLAIELLDREAIRFSDTRDAINKVLTILPSHKRDSYMWEALNSHQYFDRHNALNIRTSHGTWEFRLWNSTRAAWRMEMFVRLSIAMVDPAVTAWLARGEKNVPNLRPRGRGSKQTIEEGMDRLAVHLHTIGHTEAAVLVDRQRQYSVEEGWNRRVLFP